MKNHLKKDEKSFNSVKLLFSYLVIILAPTIAIIVIYANMQQALINIQAERVRGLTKEAAIVFDNEIDQLTNIGKYISDDGKLKEYIQNKENFDSEEIYYKTYELARTYPNYSLMNHFVKYIYILPDNNSYIIRIPQVIPDNPRKTSMLDISSSEEKNSNLLKEMSDGKAEGIRFFLDSDRNGSIWLSHSVSYREGRATVLVEMDAAQVKQCMKNILGKNKGIVFLNDSNGNIFFVYDNLNENPLRLKSESKWHQYLNKAGWKKKEISVNAVGTVHNQCEFITVIPKKVLLSEVGKTHYQILLLCIASLMVGVLICLWYWQSSRPVVRKFMKLTGQDSKKDIDFHGVPDIWKKTERVLERMDVLQTTVVKQKKLAEEIIWGRILLGSYPSEVDLKQEMNRADVSIQVMFPCCVVGMIMEPLLDSNIETLRDDLSKKMKELSEILSGEYNFYLIPMSAWKYTLILSQEGAVSINQRKEFVERVNYALYSQMPLNIYAGISDEAYDLKSVSEQYENVQRICEYARYHKVRLPLFLKDIPRNQHVVFTVDLELQLEKAIESGICEQLRILMDQIMESNMRLPEQGCQSMTHTVEIIRSVILRCLDQESCSQDRDQLFGETQRAKTSEEIEKIVFKTCSYFEQKKKLLESDEENRLKNKIMDVIRMEYVQEGFNLTALSERIHISEQKLYRDFKKLFGVSFAAYLEMQRIRSAEEKLKQGEHVQDVAENVGYNSDYSFRRAFKRVIGVTPSEYQKMYGQ